LGCGLDSSFDKYFSRTFSVDVPAVIEQRQHQQHQRPDPSRDSLVACDLRDLPRLQNALATSGINRAAPTVVLVECVLVYLQDADVCRLLEFLRNYLCQSCIVIYDVELLTYTDNYTRALSGSFDKVRETVPQARKSQSVDAERNCINSKKDWSSCLRCCGFLHVHVYAMQQIVDILAAESHSDDHSELDLNRFDSGFKCSEFDEFASLCLLRQRYVVCIASQVAHFSSTHSKQNTSAGTRVKALTARIAVAEARLGSLHIAITASKGNKTYSNNDGGANLSTVTSFGCIRACRSDDVDKVCSIYEQVRLLLSCSSHRLISMCMYLQAFADLGGRHTSVRKFVKLSVKELKMGRRFFVLATFIYILTSC
jgi:hypothetical protein